MPCAVAYRCPCSLPAVVQTAPRLDDGTPFPTLYYLTCARLVSQAARLEGEGRDEMTERLATDPDLAAAYRPPMRRTSQSVTPSSRWAPRHAGDADRVECLHARRARARRRAYVGPFGDETWSSSATGGPRACIPRL